MFVPIAFSRQLVSKSRTTAGWDNVNVSLGMERVNFRLDRVASRIKLILLPSTPTRRDAFCIASSSPLCLYLLESLALHRWIEPYPIINDRPFPSSLLFPSNSSSCFALSLSLSLEFTGSLFFHRIHRDGSLLDN